MKQKAAKLCLLIIVITIIAVPLIVGGIIVCFSRTCLFPAGVLLSGVFIYSFFHVPIGYEVSGGRLTVNFRLGSKEFGPIVSCQAIEGRLPMTWRICGVGGLFSCTGLYWNSKYGLHRVYITNHKKAALIETADRKKILISPFDPQKFADDVNEQLGLAANSVDKQTKNTGVNYEVLDKLTD